MKDNDIKRLSRLTAILLLLQTKRLVTSSELAGQFGVSVRTIYRDIRALEESGVPIVTEEGKGYSLMEGYRIPPVMFTEIEANALITAEQLVLKNKDDSFVKGYTDAINKVKSVLKQSAKDKVNLLSGRIAFAHNPSYEKTSTHLTDLQLALTDYRLTTLVYYSPDKDETTTRIVEPFALLSTQENWLLVAWCRLRKSFRTFRLDRIQELKVLNESFEPHQLTLQEYFSR